MRVGEFAADRFPRVWVDDSHLIMRRGLVATLKAGGFHVAGQSASFDPHPDPDGCDVLLFEAEGGGLRNAVRARGPAMRLAAMIRTADEGRELELARLSRELRRRTGAVDSQR